jgi:spermidine/putrescine transport system ATP-binding protein
MTEVAVELRHITRRFTSPTSKGNEVVAVDDVSMQILDGEFFSLLGPSGCGKTTTLRMIAGLDKPTRGEIFIHGQEMSQRPPFERPVNTVFQNYALFPHMTVAQNIAFGLEMRRLPRAEIERQVHTVLDLVRLPGMEARRPKQLSGGQQQRVALARALVNEPEVLLLDEPLGALDQKLRKEMQLELKALQQRVGITFVFVTHDQEEALTMSNRIAVMNLGQVLQVGSPLEIYERPNCRFVADFIGETNFLTGRVAALDGDFCVIKAEGYGMMVGQRGPDLQVGDTVTISIRPEKIHLDDRQPERTANVFPVTVEMIAYVGSDTRIIVRDANGRRLDVWEQNTISTLDAQAYYAPGDSAFMSWRPENALALKD